MKWVTYCQRHTNVESCAHLTLSSPIRTLLQHNRAIYFFGTYTIDWQRCRCIIFLKIKNLEVHRKKWKISHSFYIFKNRFMSLGTDIIGASLFTNIVLVIQILNEWNKRILIHPQRPAPRAVTSGREQGRRKFARTGGRASGCYS